MASDVGIRVGVDGAAEFKTAIRSMNGQMRTLDSEMRALTSGIDNLDDAEAAAAQRMDPLLNLEIWKKRLMQSSDMAMLWKN